MPRLTAGLLVAPSAIVLVFLFALLPFAASAATCPVLARTLARPTTGTDVSALQRFLMGQGLLTADSATGYFGPLTEKAVQSFQKAQNVVTSGTPASTGFGLVGKRTQAAIAKVCAGAASAAPARVTPVLQNATCPQVPLPIGESCKYEWKEVKDAKGCTASWKCTI